MILKKEYEWVLKILNSSINIYQIKTSENLFNAFINKWDDEISDEKKISYQNVMKLVFRPFKFNVSSTVLIYQIRVSFVV